MQVVVEVRSEDAFEMPLVEHDEVVEALFVESNRSDVARTGSANATRRLREEGLHAQGAPLWSRHGSTRYLWKPLHVEDACRYVAESQGEDLGGEL
jgi:hypothetical protein